MRKLAHLVLDELEVPQLVHQKCFVPRMEERKSLHPFEALGNAIIVHEQAGE